MSTISAQLIKETDKARLFRISEREIWIPRSVTKTITKFGSPGPNRLVDCLIDVDAWFRLKNDL